MSGAPRYLLGRTEDRGVLLGLGWEELGICGAALALGAGAILALPVAAALPLAVLAVLAAAAAVGWRVEGHRLWRWLLMWWRFGKRGEGGESQFDGTSILAVEAPGWGRVGVLRDEVAGAWGAVLATGTTPVALADEEERARCLARWAAILDQIAWGGGGLWRLTWIATTLPDPGDRVANWFLEHAPPGPSAAKAAYAELLAEAAPRAETHEIHLVVQVHDGRSARAIRRAGGGKDGALRVLLGEVDHLARALQAADVPVEGLLSPAQLAVQLRSHYSPHLLGRMRTRERGLHPAEAFCPQVTEAWDEVATDNALHWSAWVSEAPRQPAPGDFLAPLLLQGGVWKTVAVSMEPVDPERAGREAERAVVGMETDAEVLSRGGFRTSALRRRGLAEAKRREEEIASGASDWRWSAFVTVSAADKAGLERAKGIVERAAGRSRLRLLGLSGQQAKGLRATSVLASGLSPERRGVEAMASRRSLGLPAHRCASVHLCALYPFAPPPTLEAGVYVGVDPIGGGSFCFDPFGGYEAGLVTSPNMMVTGEIGKAKSSLVKTLAWRMAAVGRRIVVLDPKGEYGPLAEALGAEAWRLVPFGPVRLCPIDPGPARGRPPEERRRAQLSLLVSLLEASLGRRLAPEEHTAVGVALLQAERAAGARPTIRDVIAALSEPDEAGARAASCSLEQLKADGRPVAGELRRLCDGDLAGLFDGETTVEAGPEAHVIVDLSHLYGTPAMPLAMLCVMSWLQQGFLDPSGPRTFFVLDEAYAVLSSAPIARWMTQAWKLARAYGLSCCFVAHRVSDLAAVGDAGSEASARAEGLVADCGVRVFYGQPHEQAQLARSVFGVSEAESRLIETVPRGVAVWRVGTRGFLVRHVLSSLERPLVDTDARLGGGGAVLAIEGARPAGTGSAGRLRGAR